MERKVACSLLCRASMDKIRCVLTDGDAAICKQLVQFPELLRKKKQTF